MAGANVKRIIFREVMPGDLRKFTATSADSNTGGGARDFRFTPFEKFDGVFARALPGREKKPRVRNGVRTSVTLYTADVSIPKKNGSASTRELRFEPPTTAREGEGRLAQLSKFGLEPPAGEGRFFLLIIEDASANVILTFYSEQDLASGQWHSVVNDFFKKVLATPQKTNANQGFIDFEKHTHWIKY
ncbi:hypothetical protein OVY29_18110 [Sphingopyxis sp. SE2]|uniref:hypothetical protein n=1 Tax=Sphingopyxis sp. SE2 TaxID=1586240 RepID=UPI0028C0552B|nr:hypothetical protein [Sphingopyxis sp. SE2]MDT7530579.1 hypothetical protein [Sphingopyxis sp. SE2]